MKSHPESLVIVNSHPDTSLTAKALQAQLNIPLYDSGEVEFSLPDCDYYVHFHPEKITLITKGAKKTMPFYVDFTHSAFLTRLKTSGKSQPLGKSVGLHKTKETVRVLDATAGLGRDALTLAYLGCEVTMLECSPLVALFLHQAISEAQAHPFFNEWLTKRCVLHQINSIEYMKEIQIKPEVVYLDPMFPSRKKSALVKKEMRLLQGLLETSYDTNEELLNTALQTATQRVVVKRPKNAPALTDAKPSYAIFSPNLRYDVYL